MKKSDGGECEGFVLMAQPSGTLQETAHTLTRMHARSVCQALHVLFGSLFCSLLSQFKLHFKSHILLWNNIAVKLNTIQYNWIKIQSNASHEIRHKMHLFQGVCHDISYHFSIQGIFNVIFYVSFHYKWIILCIMYLHALLTYSLYFI